MAVANRDAGLLLTAPLSPYGFGGTRDFDGTPTTDDFAGRQFGFVKPQYDALKTTTDLVSNPRQHLAEDLPTLLVSFARSGNSPESSAATVLADEVLTSVRHLVITCDPTIQNDPD